MNITYITHSCFLVELDSCYLLFDYYRGTLPRMKEDKQMCIRDRAFPGIFRGALDVRASDINEEMKVAAAYAIASLVSDEELSVDYIIPSALNKEVGAVVAEAVAQAARESGVARI